MGMTSQYKEEAINQAYEQEREQFRNQINKSKMKTSKIKSVDSIKPWNEIFYHNLTMENGDKINIGKKKEQQVGWELNYEITDTSQEWNKAKSVRVDDFKPTLPGTTKIGGKSQNASFALSYAKDYHTVVGGKVEDILDTAQQFKEWMDAN